MWGGVAVLKSVRVWAAVAAGVVTLVVATVVGNPLVSRATEAERGSDLGAVRLRALAEAGARISYHAKTGKVRFIGVEPVQAIAVAASTSAVAEPETVARSFLGEYGTLFGIADQASELALERQETDALGGGIVRFQQRYRGIPVFGGELIVTTDATKRVLAVGGEVLPELAVDVAPAVQGGQAAEQAKAFVAAATGLDSGQLTTTEPELWVYNPGLVGAPGPEVSSLVWRVVVTGPERALVDELVLVDARQGGVLLRLSQIRDARNRVVYNANNTSTVPATPAVSEGGVEPTDKDERLGYVYSGSAYDYYKEFHGRDGIDNAGLLIRVIVKWCKDTAPCPYKNALWKTSDKSLYFGDTQVWADDTVGHEYTHGVTESSANLYYYMQSGSIDEAMADIFGELIDQWNGLGTDTPAVKWKLFEDDPDGVARDMSDPNAFKLPAKMSDQYYYCGTGDEGGVHTNLGVGSKAAYLMAEGGTFNGQTLTGVGNEKMGKIWYRVQTTKLTSASDYQDLADYLGQACDELNIGGTTTASDCQQVRKAVAAVEMSQQPAACAAPKAATCPAGEGPRDLFFDRLDTAETWDGDFNPPWSLSTTFAYSPRTSLAGQPPLPAVAGYASVAMNKSVAIPTATTVYLRFNHSYDLADNTGALGAIIGGIVEYSVDDGTTWTNAADLTWINGPDKVLVSGRSNPRQGEKAFSQVSYGYGSSRAELTTLGGQNVRIRFGLATDSANTQKTEGWYIDDVRIYTCASIRSTLLPAAVRATTLP